MIWYFCLIQTREYVGLTHDARFMWTIARTLGSGHWGADIVAVFTLLFVVPHRKAVRATLILIPLLGLQYILFPFRPEKGSALHEVYSYISAFVTSFQVSLDLPFSLPPPPQTHTHQRQTAVKVNRLTYEVVCFVQHFDEYYLKMKKIMQRSEGVISHPPAPFWQCRIMLSP